jgi:hypothetical protein
MSMTSGVYLWIKFRDVCTQLSGMINGAGGMEGVEGMLGSRLLRFQKPALVPLVMNANVQRDNPRNESG